jgi:hypothetical protein
MPSSPTYPASGSPSSPRYPASSSSSSTTYPGGGSPPPPPYQPDNNASSFTFPANASRLPSGAYPRNEANLPPQPPQQPRRGKKGMIAILVIAALVIVGGAVLTGVLYATHSPLLTIVGLGHSTPTQSTTATLAPTATPTQSTTATPTASTSTPSTTPTLTDTSTTTSSTPTPGSTGNYSATQPGPGCDTNGGTWTPQGISKITCGTEISISSNSRGYLYLQLPNNQAFSSNNSIGITATLSGSNDCVGLAEQDANTGFLVEYCNDGRWLIYSISSGGAIVKTLAQSLTSTRTTEQISLTLKGTTLSFSIDNEVHKINVSPIQPTRVAITYSTSYSYGGRVPVTNFSYTTQSS